MNDLDDSKLINLKNRVHEKLEETSLYEFKGTVSKLLGLTVEVKLPGLKIGDLCYIEKGFPINGTPFLFSFLTVNS